MKKLLSSLRRPRSLVLGTIASLLVAASPTAVPALGSAWESYRITTPWYKAQNGHWQVIELPAEFRLNSVHAALLPTGKVLLVAGSGNSKDIFEAFQNGRLDVLKTVVLDPTTLQVTPVETPQDLFCAGHAHLGDGTMLIAGGTSGYELLEGATKPAGTLTVYNTSPNDKPLTLPKGTQFVLEKTGKVYITAQEITVQPATKTINAAGKTVVTRSAQTVFIEALEPSESYIAPAKETFRNPSLPATISGVGGAMTLGRQEFRGTNIAYEFNPWTEKYEPVSSMQYHRWYPTLVQMPQNGGILAVSGLDNTGHTLRGPSEIYNPLTKTWSLGPKQYFATYPSLTLTADGQLFYSGSNSGYDPTNEGRQPGFWNVQTGAFQPVNGLRDPHLMETSATVLLPPKKGQNTVQSQRIMVLGGGETGDREGATARTDIIDLAQPEPKYLPGPDLPAATRYPIVVTLPNDEVLVTGGSAKYRGRGNSNYFSSRLYDPTANVFKPVAAQVIGRNYHSGGLLLPDGRVLVFGSDSLFADARDSQPGAFEQRLEIYSPPYFFNGARPALGNGPSHLKFGSLATFEAPQATNLQTARLIAPSSTTHATNVEQRSIAVGLTTRDHTVELDIPTNPNLLPTGWYMLFVTNKLGIPSVAKWVHIS